MSCITKPSLTRDTYSRMETTFHFDRTLTEKHYPPSSPFPYRNATPPQRACGPSEENHVTMTPHSCTYDVTWPGFGREGARRSEKRRRQQNSAQPAAVPPQVNINGPRLIQARQGQVMRSEYRRVMSNIVRLTMCQSTSILRQ